LFSHSVKIRLQSGAPQRRIFSVDSLHSVFAAELWQRRDTIEALTADVEPEPIDEFPPMTTEYGEYLRSIVQC